MRPVPAGEPDDLIDELEYANERRARHHAWLAHVYSVWASGGAGGELGARTIRFEALFRWDFWLPLVSANKQTRPTSGRDEPR